MKREIFVGPIGIGGGHPVSVQSMIKKPTTAVRAVLRQIDGLAAVGCDIVRVALPDRGAVDSFRRIARSSALPVIADVHFDGGLALAALEAGAAGLRINPGNIGGNERLRAILAEARARGVPIRIGANSGSLEKSWARRGGLSLAEKLVRSVLDRVKFFEDLGFRAIKISLKSSSVRDTVAAYRLIDRACDYPLHVGVTEAGAGVPALVKSAAGIGSLLLAGIGDTIRFSLTDEPRREVEAARALLAALDLRREGVEIVSCPTCGRTAVDLRRRVRELADALRGFSPARPLRVAVMGCEVNGPGEAAGADLGLAFAGRGGVLFARGRMLGRVEEKRALAALIDLIHQESGGGRKAGGCDRRQRKRESNRQPKRQGDR